MMDWWCLCRGTLSLTVSIVSGVLSSRSLPRVLIYAIVQAVHDAALETRFNARGIFTGNIIQQ